MIFVRGDPITIQVMMQEFQLFSEATGLQANPTNVNSTVEEYLTQNNNIYFKSQVSLLAQYPSNNWGFLYPVGN